MRKKIVLLAYERVRIPRVVVGSLDIRRHHDSIAGASDRADPDGHIASLPAICWVSPPLGGAQLWGLMKSTGSPFALSKCRLGVNFLPRHCFCKVNKLE